MTVVSVSEETEVDGEKCESVESRERDGGAGRT